MLQNSNHTFQWSKKCQSHPILSKLSSAFQGCLAGRADSAVTGWMLCAKSLQGVQLFATLWTVACQVPLSMAFSRQEYWRGLPCPPPGDNPKPGIESEFLMSLHLQGGSLSLPPPGKPHPCQGYPRIKGHQVLAPVLLLMSFSTLGKSLPLIKPQFPRLENEAV